jgi:GT2 family glycosyltransferase
MKNTVSLPITIPKFDERQYLDKSPQVEADIKAGISSSALDHYIRYVIDENRAPLVRREPAPLLGAVERFLVSQSGFCLLIGWLADEGCDQPRYRLIGGEFKVEFPPAVIFRHARSDVEAQVKSGAYDYGYVAFGRAASTSLLKQSLLLQISALSGTFQAKITPEIVSDKRLLDTLLEMIATCQAHAGAETVLHSFLTGAAGRSACELFQTHVATSTSDIYVERFGVRPVSQSFVTVLFGTSEPIMIQPLLFRAAGVDFGEWIYVCNSPEDAATVLRYAHLISDIYDAMITVVIMGDNAGFGAANNAAIARSSSDRIFIVNPDVYPLPAYAGHMRQVLSQGDLGSTLWGGLLFYDEHNLMHSDMYLEGDIFVRRNSLNRIEGLAVPSSYCRLLRVEHHDKGVPFEEACWQKPKEVAAISGALMAFDKQLFERLQGFSTQYIYGHYEDADLSLRWRRDNGPVAVHPFIRLVHLEGQGSKAKGAHYRGAATANRHLFTAQHGKLFEGR